jgi:hypothetical protein
VNMASDLVRSNLQLLRLLVRSTPKFRRELIRNAPSEFILCLVECAVNILRNKDCKISDVSFKKLKKYQRILRDIAREPHVISKKRKELTTQRGGFLISYIVSELIDHILPKLV